MSVSDQDNLPLAFVLMVIGVFVVGTMDVVAKLLSSSVPLTQIVWGRFFFHTVLMLPLFLHITKSNRKQRYQDWRGHFVRGILLMLSTVFIFCGDKRKPHPRLYCGIFCRANFCHDISGIYFWASGCGGIVALRRLLRSLAY